MATREQLPPDTTSGWRGAESPTHPKATHPVWLPSSSIPPLSLPPTYWPPSPTQWERPHLLPPQRRQCPQHEWVASRKKGDTEGVVPKPGSTFYRITQGHFYKYTFPSPLLDTLN